MPSSYRFVLKDSHPALIQELIGDIGSPSPSSSVYNQNNNNSSNNNNSNKDNPNSKNKKNRSDLSGIGILKKANQILLGPCGGGGGGGGHNASSRSAISSSSSTSVPSNQIQIQGRMYNTECSKQKSGLQLHEMTLGIKFACMSIIDDKPNTLHVIGKSNPWQIHGMKLMLQDCYRNSNLNGNNSITTTTTTTAIKNDINQNDPKSSSSASRTTTTVPNWEEEINLPLSVLMKKYYNITIDHHMDYSGWTNAGGHVVDTQGYIGHDDGNDGTTMVVLSYRCTTSIKDWLTNLSTTTSAWETIDIENGHSGRFSGIDDFFSFPSTILGSSNGKKGKQTNDKNVTATTATTPATPATPATPTTKTFHKKERVHTGFYNNFLCSVQDIQKYIDPLLLDTTKPKTLYITGHSLGGGIAHMALFYFLLENKEKYKWDTINPHRIVLVTAGSPRVCTTCMQRTIDSTIQQINQNNIHSIQNKKDTISIIRLVRDMDVVSHVPPTSLGYKHLDSKVVYITKDDAILINPNLKNVITKKRLEQLIQRHPSIVTQQQEQQQKRQVKTLLQQQNNNEDNTNNKITIDTDDDDDDDNDATNDFDDERVDDTTALIRMKQCSMKWFGSTADNKNDDRQVVEQRQDGNNVDNDSDGHGTHHDTATSNNSNSASCTSTGAGNNDGVDKETKKYKDMLKLIPRPVRDHMPEFYLQPLMSLFEVERTIGSIDFSYKNTATTTATSMATTNDTNEISTKSIHHSINNNNLISTEEVVNERNDFVVIATSSTSYKDKSRCNMTDVYDDMGEKQLEKEVEVEASEHQEEIDVVWNKYNDNSTAYNNRSDMQKRANDIRKKKQASSWQQRLMIWPSRSYTVTDIDGCSSIKTTQTFSNKAKPTTHVLIPVVSVTTTNIEPKK